MQQKETRFFELIRLQRDSGLSVREFCSNEGIAPSTFYYWKKKLRGKGSGRKNDFIPLLVKSPGDELSRGAACPEISTNSNTLFELVYPNGTKLRLKKDLDLSDLRTLIHLYD
jgi:transposase-like protein